MIRTEELSVAFPGRGVVAVDRISLRVAAGDRVALLGQSGAGKSTLLRALLGAVPATGTVRVGGLDPYGSAEERRAVRQSAGFVRQGGDLVLGLSARLNAVMGTTPHWGVIDWIRLTPAAYEERLAALAEEYRIADCLAVPVRQLSGGQRQRVALVRALLPGPSLLLADEPTSGLDPVNATAAVDALLAAPATVLVATHDLAVARRFPRILALREGRVVYDGADLDELLARDVYRRNLL